MRHVERFYISQALPDAVVRANAVVASGKVIYMSVLAYLDVFPPVRRVI